MGCFLRLERNDFGEEKPKNRTERQRVHLNEIFEPPSLRIIFEMELSHERI